MAYIYRDGKVINIPTGNIKLPQEIIDKVDNNPYSKKVIADAIKSIENAKVKYEF